MLINRISRSLLALLFIMVLSACSSNVSSDPVETTSAPITTETNLDPQPQPSLVLAYPSPAAANPQAEAYPAHYPRPIQNPSPADTAAEAGWFNPADPESVTLDSGGPLLVGFYTPECLTCQEMQPTIETLEGEFIGEITFILLDSASHDTEKLRRTLGFRTEPHFFLIDQNGSVVSEWTGFVPEQDFQSAFAAILSEQNQEN